MTHFPLAPSPDGRRLQDSSGRPYLYHADTAWFLPLTLPLEEGRALMAARKAQGFGAIQMQLTGFLGMSDVQGRRPFGDRDLFNEPNEGFFDHVDQVFHAARELDLMVFMAPLWSGCCGEGWAGQHEDGSPKPLNSQGPEAAEALGRWLGQRYSSHQHIGWILGGDNDPFMAFEEIGALGRGLKEGAPHHLTTFHACYSHSSTDVFPDENWLDVSMVYTYFRGFNKAWNKVQPDVYEVCALERRKSPALPFFLGESTYEGEHDDWGSAHQVRKQAYWSVLSGGTGHAYGSDNWRAHPHWRDLIQKPGALSLGLLPKIMGDLEWWSLEPDTGEWVSESGPGYARNDHLVAAGRPDGRLAAAYIPSPRRFSLAERAEGMAARWFDPVSGESSPAEPLPGSQGPSFEPKGPNSGGDPDWILVLENS